MLFNSPEFAVFFGAVLLAYYFAPKRFKVIILLCASYFFYASYRIEYVLILAAITLINYFCGMAVEKSRETSAKKFFLGFSIAASIGALVFFKYFNFLSESLNDFFHAMNVGSSLPLLELVLPIGISFFTFQAVGYTIDIYRKKIKPEKNPAVFALFVSFFPQILSGPIGKAEQLLPQLKENHDFEPEEFVSGAKFVVWGLFKKIVIADRLGPVVAAVFSAPTDFSGLSLIIATVFFGFQLYCDFSGYTDIALGLAKMLGINLIQNFNQPYHSKSIKEFWRRWHISLMNWFRDYIYIPLGGNRVGKARQYLNIMIVFLVSGLWHGAAWTFVLWGLIHGAYMVFFAATEKHFAKAGEKIWLARFPKINSGLKIITTFALVNFAWIFFRAKSIPDALYISSNLFNGTALQFAAMGSSALSMAVCFGLIIFLEVVDLFQEKNPSKEILMGKPKIIRWGFYIVLVWCIIWSSMSVASLEFIYFQF